MPRVRLMVTQWYYVRDGQRIGPRPREELAALIATGLIDSGTLVWSTGISNWMPNVSLYSQSEVSIAFVSSRFGLHRLGCSQRRGTGVRSSVFRRSDAR